MILEIAYRNFLLSLDSADNVFKQNLVKNEKYIIDFNYMFNKIKRLAIKKQILEDLQKQE